MLNICSSVHDHNQSTIHKDSDWTSQRAKEFYLKLRASGRMRLKKWVWRSASEDTGLKIELLKTRHQKQWSSEAMVIRSISPEATSPELTKYSVRSVQPLTLQPPSLQPCLYIKTRITVILLQTLFRFVWNGFEISSSQDNYQIRQKINGEESKLQARQVDVTANSQRLLNPLYIGIKTWRTKTQDRIQHIQQATRPKLSVQNVVNTSTT